jgi:chromate transporter
MTFGGGYAMLPIIEREIVDKKRWATLEEISDYFALGQVTPGVIAVNVATFIGYKRKGVAGGICATLGLIFPSFIIITLIAAFLTNFAHIALVRHAFAGIRIAVGVLIVQAVIKLFKNAVKEWKALIICAAAFVVSAVFSASPVLIVFAAALTGFLLYRPRKGKSPGGGQEAGA